MVPAAAELSRCDEVQARLSELLDGELDAPDAARVALHLAGCPACARLAAELAATVRALRRLAGRCVGPARPLH
jgi:anti-sigma factor RsiW